MLFRGLFIAFSLKFYFKTHITYSYSYSYFKNKQRLHSRHLASYLVYGSDEHNLVSTSTARSRNKSTHRGDWARQLQFDKYSKYEKCRIRTWGEKKIYKLYTWAMGLYIFHIESTKTGILYYANNTMICIYASDVKNKLWLIVLKGRIR
jgi:hypothetical protein